jgi:hypothetical protein
MCACYKCTETKRGLEKIASCPDLVHTCRAWQVERWVHSNPLDGLDLSDCVCFNGPAGTCLIISNPGSIKWKADRVPSKLCGATMIYVFYPLWLSILADNYRAWAKKWSISEAQVDHTAGNSMNWTSTIKKNLGPTKVLDQADICVFPSSSVFVVSGTSWMTNKHHFPRKVSTVNIIIPSVSYGMVHLRFEYALNLICFKFEFNS